MPYTDAEVVEYAAALLQETQLMREEAIRYDKVANMYLFPKLPADMSRNEDVFLLSPEVIHEVREMKARVKTFETEIQCLALHRTAANTISAPEQSAVDALEKAGATFLQRLDPTLDLLDSVTYDQGVKPLAIVILELGAIDKADPAERFPWSSFQVELDGCGWLEEKGIPTVAGRQYSQFITRTENQYSMRKDSPEGPGMLFTFEGGRWDWKKASSDWTPRRMPQTTQTDKFEAAQMVWLDDGETIYQVALNRPSQGFGVGPIRIGKTTKQTGKLAWSMPNPFGRVSMFLIPSNTTTARNMQDRYLPYYWDYITTTEQENMIDTMRATGARNRLAPRDYWHADPEFIKDYMRNNGGKMPPPVEWADGKTPVGWGELKTRPVEIDPDLDKLDAKLEARKQKFSAGTSSTLRDADVLEHSTASAILAAYDSENTSLSVVVGPQDTWRKDMLVAWEHSIKWLGDPKNSTPTYSTGPAYAKFSFLASDSGPSTKSMKQAGEPLEIDASSFEVKHEWRVITRQRSRGQSQAEFAAAVERMAPLVDGRPNVGVYEDLFTAAHVSNVAERRVTLAKEALMWEVVDPATVERVKASLDYFIELDTGERPGLIPPPAPDPNMAPPPGQLQLPPGGGGDMPNTGATQNSPVTEPTQGGTAGVNMQAG